MYNKWEKKHNLLIFFPNTHGKIIVYRFKNGTPQKTKNLLRVELVQ